MTFVSAVITDNVSRVYSPFEFYVSERKPNLKYEIMYSTSGSHQEGRILAGRTTLAALHCGLFVQKTCQHEGYMRMLYSAKWIDLFLRMGGAHVIVSAHSKLV